MTAQPLRIDFVSDVACPWCAIGLLGLLRALDAIGDAVKAEIHFQPFELNLGLAPEGENAAEHLLKKYRTTQEQSAAARQAIIDRGAALGFAFNFTRESRIWNTFDAHRLLHWAGLEGKQIALKQALFKAYFTDQLPANDPGVLAEAARQAGLDLARARAILASDEFAKEVTEAQVHWRRSGVQAVPMIVFNQHWALQGGQPPEVFEQAIRDILAGKAKPA